MYFFAVILYFFGWLYLYFLAILMDGARGASTSDLESLPSSSRAGIGAGRDQNRTVLVFTRVTPGAIRDQTCFKQEVDPTYRDWSH